MRRLLVVEFADATTLEVHFGVRSDDLSHALSVFISVDMTTGQLGMPTISRCVADAAGEVCRVLGGLSTHTDVTADLLQPAYTEFNTGGQEGLFTYLEGML